MAFECGICTSVYNTGVRIPLLLECGHTFCQSCVQHNLGAQRCCPYCRHPIQKHVDDLPRNYALENAMEAANLPLVELMDRWGLSNAERMMVKPDHLSLDSLMSRKGYTGEVWKGSLWGKPVAVKLLPLLDVDERQLECLRREVAVLLHTTGECKQVCIYKGFCVKNGNFAIIMKLYSCSLACRISKAAGRRLPLPLALKYSIDIVKGLVELHRLGVIAADLKPDNVLIDEELGDAVIADFGISSVVTTTIGNTGRGSSMRSSGAMRGTPNYMAPEQFAPGCRTTNKVDIWGFAATLLHMITGAPPWHHDTLMQICTAVGVSKLAPPLPEGLPKPLQALMATCFEAEPSCRPTAVQLLKALQAMNPVLAQHMAALACSNSSNGADQQAVQSAAHAGKDPAAAADDKQGGVDQYLAQLGLSSPYSRQEAVSSGGGGMPSAPPLPGGGSSSGPTGAGIYSSSSAACLGRRSSSNGGGGGRQKLPRVIWSEEEAVREERAAQQQQQHRMQHSSTTVGCVGSLQSPAAHVPGQQQPQQARQQWAPHHTRSASEQVTGLSSKAYQQQLQQQQLVQPQEVVGAAPWPVHHHEQQQQQSHHSRSKSEVTPGWGHAAPESAAGGTGYLSSRAARGADNTLLPTHFEAGAGANAPDAAGGPTAAVVNSSPVKRQRQQWHTAAAAGGAAQAAQQQAAVGGCVGSGEVPVTSAAADDAAGYSRWAAEQAGGQGPLHSNNTCWGEPTQNTGKQQGWMEQQRHAEADPHTPMGRPWWETPFDASSCRSPSPEAAAAGAATKAATGGKSPAPSPLVTAAGNELQQCPDQRATSSSKQGVPLPLLVHAHAEGVAAAAGSIHNAVSSNSSSASLSRAASFDSTLSGRRDSRPCASVCSRPGSAKRPQRTLTNLLLGRAASRAALPCELVVTDSASSCGSAAAVTIVNPAVAASGGGVSYSQGSSSSLQRAGSYSPRLAKIRMAFGPASPERVPRGGAFSSGALLVGGSILTTAAAAVGATGCAGTAAAAAAAAAAAGGVTAAAASGAGAAALFGASTGAAGAAGFSGGAALTSGAACTAGAASAAAVIPVSSAAVAASSGGVMAAVASRFTKGPRRSPKHKPDTPAAPQITEFLQGVSAACESPPVHITDSAGSINTSSTDKPSRWRALFGSPSRRRPTAQVCSPGSAAARHGSVFDSSTGCQSSRSCPESALQASSCSSSPAGYAVHQQGQSAGLTAATAARRCSVEDPEVGAPLSPCKASSVSVTPPPGPDGTSSGGLNKLPLTPGSAASHAAAVAAAEAARASGSCSPLKAHARNLSLPSKLLVLGGSTEPSPASSTNPVANASSTCSSPAQKQQGTATQQQQIECAAAVVAAGPCSPSRLGPSSSSNSRGSSGGGSGAAAAGDAGGSGSGGGGCHSQALAEAVQLEVLARNLSQGGRHVEAEAALRSSLALLGKQLGPSHPNTVAATTRLALHLNRNAKHTEAERLLRQVLSHKQAMVGRKHPQVAAASINLAACLYSQGHFNAAARLYAAALEVRRGALGEAHPDTAACINNLALCHSRLGDWTEAEQLFCEALSARVAALGQLHPDVAITAHQLGHCLGQLGQHSEALVYHKQGLWVRQQQERRDVLQQDGSSSSADGSSSSAGSGTSGGGSGNPAEDLVASHRCVALCLARLGCDSQAQEHLAHVVRVRSSQVEVLNPPPAPGNSSTTGGTLGGRGHHSRNPSAISTSAGKLGAMDDVDWSVLAEGDSRLSKQQADGLLALASAAEELGRCLSRQGKHAEAEEQYWKALESRSQVLGSRHELVMATEEQLRSCLEQQC